MKYEERDEGRGTSYEETAKGGNEEHDFRLWTGRSTSMRINKGRYEERSTMDKT
jgi:hypothetical protein